MATVTLELFPDTNTRHVRPKATFFERACRVWGVNEVIKPIRDHPSVKGSPLHEDLENFHSLVRTNAVLLWNLHHCTTNIAFAYNFLMVSSQDRVNLQIRSFSNMQRLSFATIGNFFLESMLRDLVSDLGEEPKKNFHKLSEQAIRLAELPNSKEQADGLRVISKLRNTLHNRGIHVGYQGRDEKITVKGVTFQFNHDDIVKGHASWDYICHRFTCALTTIYQILEIARPIGARK